jgi:hypothetical protein
MLYSICGQGNVVVGKTEAVTNFILNFKITFREYGFHVLNINWVNLTFSMEFGKWFSELTFGQTIVRIWEVHETMDKCQTTSHSIETH